MNPFPQISRGTQSLAAAFRIHVENAQRAHLFVNLELITEVFAVAEGSNPQAQAQAHFR
jgi:hypothetical protein